MDEPTDFAFSPDSTKLFYIAIAEVDGAYELWIVDLASPGIARRASFTGVTGSINFNVEIAFWTPDSQRIVYAGRNPNTGASRDMIMTDATGTSTTPIRLHPPFAQNGRVGGGGVPLGAAVKVDPKNRGVYYIADALRFGRHELFFSPFDSPGTMINIGPILNTQAEAYTFRVSPDGDLLVWGQDPRIASRVAELFSIDTSQRPFGQLRKVNGPLQVDGHVDTYLSETRETYQIVGDGQAVIYTADQTFNAVQTPFLVYITNGIPGVHIELANPMANSGHDVVQVYQ